MSARTFFNFGNKAICFNMQSCGFSFCLPYLFARALRVNVSLIFYDITALH